jgi:hypothetical protein
MWTKIAPDRYKHVTSSNGGLHNNGNHQQNITQWYHTVDPSSSIQFDKLELTTLKLFEIIIQPSQLIVEAILNKYQVRHPMGTKKTPQ